MRNAPNDVAMSALSALSAFLDDEELMSFSYVFPFRPRVRASWESVHHRLYCPGGEAPPPAVPCHAWRLPRLNVGGVLRCHQHSSPAEMIPLTGLFTDTGLVEPPTLPQLGDFVLLRLEEAIHPAWSVVTTEWLFDFASTWFATLCRDEVLIRKKACFAGDVQPPLHVRAADGSAGGVALAFKLCVMGTSAFPWQGVTSGVAAGGAGDAARAVAVRYIPQTLCGFATIEDLPGFPQADEPAEGLPLRRPPPPRGG